MQTQLSGSDNSTHEKRLAIFASGSGTNAEAIMTHFANHPLVAVAALLSNNPHAYALQRAQKFNVPTFVFNRHQFKESHEVLNWLTEKKITHLVLAGFMWLVPDYLVKAYAGRIINIHPALLPRYGGKGMYGMHVHQAVKAAGEKETGITIHLVNERYDEGKILLQARVKLTGTETAEEIAAKVHELEYRHYPDVIEKWARNS
ncbi:MAG: phosphoribosylglycinamide formyltransferase [Flammeovirgaceae bacterium]|nr:MAG: phosphoribosylglycinamide formyltransferase [Flammeovirgaceae bacterium]